MKAILACAIMVTAVLFCGCEEGVFDGGKKNVTGADVVSRYQEKAVEILYASLTDPSWLIRANATEVVVTTGRRDMMPVIVKLLKDESVIVRFSATMAIADFGYTRGAISIRRLLSDPDLNVRIAAAYTLTKLKKGELSEEIYAALDNRDQTIRANATLLLGKLGDRKALPALNAIAGEAHSGDAVRMRAAESIAMLGGDDRTYRQLWAFLMSKYNEDRVVGIRAMGALGTTESQNAILSMLTDESVEIRLLAAEQLGRAGIRAGKEDVVEYFKKVRKSLDVTSRQQADLIAVMAIGRIEGTGLEDFLPKFLASNSKDMRLQAAQSVLLLNRR